MRVARKVWLPIQDAKAGWGGPPGARSASPLRFHSRTSTSINAVSTPSAASISRVGGSRDDGRGPTCMHGKLGLGLRSAGHNALVLQTPDPREFVSLYGRLL